MDTSSDKKEREQKGKARRKDTMPAILRLLEAVYPDTLYSGDIVETLAEEDYAPSTINNGLKSLLQEGKIDKPFRGTWLFVPADSVQTPPAKAIRFFPSDEELAMMSVGELSSAPNAAKLIFNLEGLSEGAFRERGLESIIGRVRSAQANTFFLRSSTDYMEGSIRKNSIVEFTVIDTDSTPPSMLLPGIYFYSYNGKTGIARLEFIDDQTIDIIPENPKYDGKRLQLTEVDDFRLLGRIV